MITSAELNRLRNNLGVLRHDVVTVTDTAADILPDEPERIRQLCVIVNEGAGKCYLALGETATTARHLPLASGQAFSLDKGRTFSSRVSAICASGETAELRILTATISPEAFTDGN